MGQVNSLFDPRPTHKLTISVGDLIEDPRLQLEVRLLAGKGGLTREIDHPRIQKSGLAMVGHMHGLVPTRIQILGETELTFVEALPEERRRQAARDLFSLGLACVIITRGAEPPDDFISEAERTDTPTLVCRQRSSVAITAIHTLLDELLAPRTRIHAVLVDVFEVGVLLLGRSGIGKSETALELVMRGHKLVADDVVECDYRPPGMVFAEPAELLRHHIEVRGLGILDIKDLYGVTAIRERKRIDLVVRLQEDIDESRLDRLGPGEGTYEILGVPIREVLIPVRPGRNASAIIEIAARNELLRQAGRDATRAFLERVESASRLATPSTQPPRAPLSPRDSHAPARSVLESSIPAPVKKKGNNT